MLNAPASNAGYGEQAEELVRQYEGVTFEEVHREVLHLFPERPSAVLDLGAGTGRDAAALAARGHRVVAAEPTAELRRAGQRLHRDTGIRWVDDALPEAPGLRASGERFDLILLSAVWMHLADHERPSAMATLARLIAPGGRVLLSLRHGPVPPGRRMFEITPEETVELARARGLDLLHVTERTDLHDRPGVSWHLLGFESPASPGRAAA
ncbi:bifunctional 2-polyprenyl-6-hydroxyphenol methylase/3-demethylubiquinol 3-O-methyltransferase UbiG [Kitasatospora sp. A2-31]|uniref:class I SAM-dependent methyltransferase n=1 Tax=Kitasatospora sp. A2-31 TaxID=2916414 RepID=UPI001EE7A737|nr:class I SAM-dependent methyltransferase [Kitasatospora sp. A2-31]MCG6493743.1 class I SAM-dependent methyltransferase [Kitasatospora sp. A2-31]